MTKTKVSRVLLVFVVFAMLAAACGSGDEPVDAEGFKFGMILVGPQNDRGYSQAHFEGGQYVAEQTGAEMIVLDKVNPADLPEKTVDQVAADMIAEGAQLVIATSDDMKDGILLAAEQNPDVPMIWSSGDSAWEDGKSFAGLDNLGNVFSKMEFGKMIAGCAAGLTTQTGSIGYVGPLLNDETRRLVNSAYLGASYCYDEYRGESSALDFTVTWIGFWFNIPGVTLDPTQVSNEFLDSGADVLISGIDTTEALVEAGKRAGEGQDVWSVPYDYEDACAEAPDICLGTPYFNWGPAYLDIVNSVVNDDFQAEWTWYGPDWDNLGDNTKSAIGWTDGDGLPEDAAGDLADFIDGLGSGDINLFTGPLNYQDGSVYLEDGEEATDFQIWYTEGLLAGVTGEGG
ncbi:MAG: BMP family ABC transporter substrate-binding protein [Acidimicrobiia bacterium]|nr:BMP family ABC transporter substrate-binding protein [Acidimicrobiia bacterium]